MIQSSNRERKKMARFRATMQGSRGPASRLGHEIIEASVNGWNAGVSVTGTVDVNGNDIFKIWATSGSNNRQSSKLIATVKSGDKPNFELSGNAVSLKGELT
jgi:hypothetical protein